MYIFYLRLMVCSCSAVKVLRLCILPVQHLAKKLRFIIQSWNMIELVKCAI